MAAADVDVAVPATHHTAAVPASACATAVFPPPSTIVCIAASACVSKLLAYYGTLAVSLVYFVRAAWPDRVDAVLSPLLAHARRAALLERADLEADLRLIREAYPATEAVFAVAEKCARLTRAAVAGCAGGARRKVEAKWSEHKDAAAAAWALLRLAGRAARLAATVLLDDLIDDRKGDEEAEEEAAGFELSDVVSVVEIGFCLLVSIRLISVLTKISGTQFATACLALTCAVLVLVDDWIDPPDDDADETDAADAADTATNHGERTLVDVELEVRKSWQIVRFVTLVAYCADAAYLHLFFGPQPIALALLAFCNFAVLSVGRRVELSPDDEEGAAAGVGAAVDKWRRGAVAVFVASSVKVLAFLVVYLVQDFFHGPPPLSFVLLGLMGDILLGEEDYLLDLADTDDDEDGEEDGGAAAAGSSEDVAGGVEEGAMAKAEQSNARSSSEDEEEANASSSENEEEANASSSENEEESRVLEEHCVISEDHFIQKDISEDHEQPKEQEQDREQPKEQEQEEPDSSSGGISEDHFVQKDISEVDEHPKEEQQEEPDSSSGGSSDDGWDLVDVDPEMQDKDIYEANPKSSSLFPWKQAA